MKLFHFALMSLLLCLPAQAQEIEYGKGLICDTRQQAERLVRHLDGDVGAALRAVNAEEHDPNACAVVTVAFVRGPELATVRSRDATFQIVGYLLSASALQEDFNLSPLPLTSRSSASTSTRCSLGIHLANLKDRRNATVLCFSLPYPPPP
jgi:hypothetical protein